MSHVVEVDAGKIAVSTENTVLRTGRRTKRNFSGISG